MDLERARTFLLALPHAVETEQFGGLVFWMGDKAIGGKMFTMLNLPGAGHPISFAVGPERFHELLERDAMLPAPYLARVFWVAAERWDALRHAEWEAELRAAHAVVRAKLPARTQRLLELPKAELKKQIAERRKLLANKAGSRVRKT